MLGIDHRQVAKLVVLHDRLREQQGLFGEEGDHLLRHEVSDEHLGHALTLHGCIGAGRALHPATVVHRGGSTSLYPSGAHSISAPVSTSNIRSRLMLLLIEESWRSG